MFKPTKPLKEPESIEHGYNYALFLLNLSMRTVAEMQEKMTKRGYAHSVVTEVLTRLQEEHLLNDENYAEVMIESMKRYKYYGSFMIKKKLLEKKLPKEIILDKLEQMLSTEDEQEIALRYIEKECSSLAEAKQLPQADKQKLMRRLLSRGFSASLVLDLLGS